MIGFKMSIIFLGFSIILSFEAAKTISSENLSNTLNPNSPFLKSGMLSLIVPMAKIITVNKWTFYGPLKLSSTNEIL